MLLYVSIITETAAGIKIYVHILKKCDIMWDIDIHP